MHKYILLLTLLLFSCDKEDDTNINQLEAVTYTDIFTTATEHDSTYKLEQGRLTLTIVGSGGGGGGGSSNQGSNDNAAFASGGGGGAGEVVVIENLALGRNPNLKVIIRSAGLGGNVNNSGSNGGTTEVQLIGNSTNLIGLALGGKGGKGGDIFEAGEGGIGYPNGQSGLNGNLSTSPQQLPGGSGGDNGANYGSGGSGGLGEATNNGEATLGGNGAIGYVKIEIIGERLVEAN
ncbi:hypothetical protein [Lacinutrix chionoecetis]